MNKIFNKLNNNLFKIEDNYICVSDKKVMDESITPFYDSLTKTIRSNRNMSLDGCTDIIFSTKFIHETIPVLNTDNIDNIEELSDNNSIGDGGIINYQRKDGFIKGYEKAEETFKYTEKDLKRAIKMARLITDGSSRETFDVEAISGLTEICTYNWNNRYEDEEIVQSLQKPKEIKSIEVEYEEYIEEDTGTELKWINTRPITLPNGKVKCKINYTL